VGKLAIWLVIVQTRMAKLSRNAINVIKLGISHVNVQMVIAQMTKNVINVIKLGISRVIATMKQKNIANFFM